MPNFVKVPSVYKQWVQFWLSESQRHEIEFIGTGKIAAKTSPDFVEALQTTSKESYFLTKGGAILETITEAKLPILVDELFATLVVDAPEVAEEIDSTTFLEIQCEETIQKTKLVKNRFFKKDGMKIQCPIASTATEVIKFSYAIGNGSPVWLGQKVALRKYPHERDLTIDAWLSRFRAMVEYEFVKDKESLAAFVCPTEDQMRDKDVRNGLAILATRARVVNLNNVEEARAALDQIAEIQVVEH
jgi:hypothetical protein